ncbi:MAG: hypothetical protein KDA93_22105 [Planctomycetaceae bacterium]|nr:hypothetical protein [Planctomycetaceae bacterium]
MKITQLPSLLLASATLVWGASQADAQHHHHHHHHRPSYHIDHHNHTVRDSHGHVIGRYHHDVIHRDSTYIVPHTSGHHHGSYYVQGGSSFYIPQTASASGSHATLQPTEISFGGFSHVDDLASRLETLSNEFCLDLHYNYSHNPGFRETYTESYQVLEVAKYIHAAEHQNDRQAIQEKLQGLDQLVHHVQADVRGWSRHQHRQIGQLGILSKLDLIESTLHHLMNDVGVTATPVSGNEQAPPPAGGPEQAPPPSGFNPIQTAPPATVP